MTHLMFAFRLDLQPTRVWSRPRLVFGLGSAHYVLTTAAIVAVLVLGVAVACVPWQSALVAAVVWR